MGYGAKTTTIKSRLIGNFVLEHVDGAVISTVAPVIKPAKNH